MKTLIIPIHSFIDVVTNSSTSIYVGCHDNTIEYAKELIDNLLKVVGSNKKAEDLFTFALSMDFEEEYDRIIERLEDYYKEEEIKGLDWEGKEKLAKIIYDKIIEGKLEPYDNFGKNWDGDIDRRSLIITSKNDDKLTIDLTDQMQKIFSI